MLITGRSSRVPAGGRVPPAPARVPAVFVFSPGSALHRSYQESGYQSPQDHPRYCACVGSRFRPFHVIPSVPEMLSGPNETRTHDLFNAIEALSQLSYRPTLPTILVGEAPCVNI